MLQKWVLNWHSQERVYFVSSAESAHALKYVSHVIQMIFFVRCIPKVIQVGVILRVESWFSALLKLYRTSAEKSTFRTQNDTDKAKFQCTADKNAFFCKFNRRFCRAVCLSSD